MDSSFSNDATNWQITAVIAMTVDVDKLFAGTEIKSRKTN